MKNPMECLTGTNPLLLTHYYLAVNKDIKSLGITRLADNLLSFVNSVAYAIKY